jgi:uncharacterized protein YfiM (DUF2279 family)
VEGWADLVSSSSLGLLEGVELISGSPAGHSWMVKRVWDVDVYQEGYKND